MKKNNLSQLVKCEKYIANQVRLSNLINRLDSEQNDRLEYTYKQAREEGFRVARNNYDIEIERRLAEQHRDLLAQQASKTTEYVQAELVHHNRWLVHNWRDYWKWFSSWAFIVIMFVATVPIPDAVLNILPEHVRQAVIALVALAGLILRFVNQTKPPVLGEKV